MIGLHITRHGNGIEFERRPVGASAMLVYTIGRSQLLELFHRELHSDVVRVVDNEMSRRATQQLEALETEYRDSGVVYICPPGQHDDLGISCAMLAWAAGHPHLPSWLNMMRPPSRITRLSEAERRRITLACY